MALYVHILGTLLKSRRALRPWPLHIAVILRPNADNIVNRVQER
jgi:hypothetical protein